MHQKKARENSVRIYIERDMNLAIVGWSCTSDSGACARLAVTDPVSAALLECCC
jgi:hypothetical protein